MYRFLLRPRWILFHLVVAVAVVGMVGLGFWQRERLSDRREFNALVEERRALPPVPLETLLPPGTGTAGSGSGDAAALDELEWRPVTVRGTYLADEQLLVVNRSQGGAAGTNTVAPLRLADGRLVLVNRGFVPLPATASPPFAGEVTVTGRVRLSEQRRFGQLTDPADGDLREVQRLDIERLAAQMPGQLLPVWVDLVRSEPAEASMLTPVPPPELTEGSHLSYMFQWWFFSAAVATGWVVAVRRSMFTRQRDATAPREAPTQPDVDAASTAPH